MAIHLSPLEAAALQAGTFELTPETLDAPDQHRAGRTRTAMYAAGVIDDAIEHDPLPPDDSPAARAVAEAFAREQAALELWGSDEASAVLDSAASEAVTRRYPEPVDAVDSIEAIEASRAGQAPTSWAASVNTDGPRIAPPIDEPAPETKRRR